MPPPPPSLSCNMRSQLTGCAISESLLFTTGRGISATYNIEIRWTYNNNTYVQSRCVYTVESGASNRVPARAERESDRKLYLYIYIYIGSLRPRVFGRSRFAFNCNGSETTTILYIIRKRFGNVYHFIHVDKICTRITETV